MSVKNRLQKSIYSVLKHNRDGSYETQSARKHILYQAASELVSGGYKLNATHGLKQKHIYYSPYAEGIDLGAGKSIF